MNENEIYLKEFFVDEFERFFAQSELVELTGTESQQSTDHCFIRGSLPSVDFFKVVQCANQVDEMSQTFALKSK